MLFDVQVAALKTTNCRLLEDIERLKKTKDDITGSSSSLQQDDHQKKEVVPKLRNQVYQMQQKVKAADKDHARLLDENDRLRRELSCFDLEFFEQLEDLKYSHSEAKKTLEGFGIV